MIIREIHPSILAASADQERRPTWGSNTFEELRYEKYEAKMLLYYPAFKDIQRQSEIDSHREVVESFSINPTQKIMMYKLCNFNTVYSVQEVIHHQILDYIRKHSVKF